MASLTQWTWVWVAFGNVFRLVFRLGRDVEVDFPYDIIYKFESLFPLGFVFRLGRDVEVCPLRYIGAVA